MNANTILRFALIPAFVVATCSIGLAAEKPKDELCDGHVDTKKKWQILTGQDIFVAAKFEVPGDSRVIHPDGKPYDWGPVKSKEVFFTVASHDRDDHVCKIPQSPVRNLIAITPVVVTARLDSVTGPVVGAVTLETPPDPRAERIWTGSWPIPEELSGKVLVFVYHGKVDDVPCPSHPNSDDKAVELTAGTSLTAVRINTETNAYPDPYGSFDFFPATTIIKHGGGLYSQQKGSSVVKVITLGDDDTVAGNLVPDSLTKETSVKWNGWNSHFDNEFGLQTIWRGPDSDKAEADITMLADDDGQPAEDGGHQAVSSLKVQIVQVDLDGKDAITGQDVAEEAEDTAGVLIQPTGITPAAVLIALPTHVAGCTRTLSFSDYGKVLINGKAENNEMAIGGDEKATFTIQQTGTWTSGESVTATLTVRIGNKLIGTDNVKLVVLKVVLKSIEFTSDHEDANGANILKKSPNSKYADVGATYSEPEWTATGDNNPITHTRNIKVGIKAKLKAEPSGISLKLLGDGPNDYVDFESAPFTSTGSDQEITMTANAALPNSVCFLSKTISWKAVVVGTTTECDCGPTGPHEIFVTFDKPKETATRYANRLTYMRVKLMCHTVANGDTTEDQTAAHMHQWVKNNIPFQGPPDAWSESAIWGLVDGVGKGQCHQGGNLMDFGMRQIGVESTFEHIKASARVPILFATAQPCALEKRPDPTRNPPIPACPHGHGDETLRMWLNNAWNEGEGSCRVGAKVYAAFVNAVGDDQGKRTAEHHILILFQGIYGQDFQRWLQQNGSPCGDWEPVPAVP